MRKCPRHMLFPFQAHVTGRKFQSFEVLRGEAVAEFHFFADLFVFKFISLHNLRMGLDSEISQ